MSQFPDLKPSWPQLYAWRCSCLNLSGFVWQRNARDPWRHDARSYACSLEFANLQEAVVQQITAHWYACLGTALDFTLPPNVWAGWAGFSSAVRRVKSGVTPASPVLKVLAPVS